MAEKGLNDLSRDLRPLYTKGNDALQRDNFDYAIEMFSHVLSKEPRVFECRRALRTAQLRKAGSGHGFFKKMLSSTTASPLVTKAHMALRKDPGEALQLAEQILTGDPYSSPAHRIVVEAAQALEMPQTAVLSLEILMRNSPKDRDLAIQLAYSLADTGDVKRAEKILSDLCRQQPGDNDLALALKNVSARKTMNESGYEKLADGSGSYRDILKDKKEAVALEQENRQVKTENVAERLMNEYETRLATEPNNVKLLRSMAELCAEKKQFDRALEFYNRIKATDVGADSSLDSAIATTMIKKFDQQLSQLDVSAEDYAEKSAELENEKQTYKLAECQQRAERFPTDLQIRFELGQIYFQMGKIKEAIQEFQKSLSNPNRRIPSMNYLAQCFAKSKMYDMAARKLQEALKEKPVFDEEKKDLIYNLGCMLENLGKKEEAIEQFKVIYEADISYRDVGAKVDAYYAGG